MSQRSISGIALRAKAFTLVELLIVVAIIAILASIAVPNLLDAQIRAKVSRAESDLRTINTALESYRVDSNQYPPTPLTSLPDRKQRLSFLTTPIAYLASIPTEAFWLEDRNEVYAYWSANLNDAMKFSPIYFFLEEERQREGRWVVFSRGPDIDYEAAIEEGGGGLLLPYDPTNGTTSNGDIMKFGP